MNILGISAYYHDSAACLVRGGEIVAAAQEERFSRKKHDAAFPARAVEYCLREAGIGAQDLDAVAFYDKPLLKFDRLLQTYVSYAPSGFKPFALGLPSWLRQKLNLPRALDAGLGGRYRGRYVFLEHHESHAASAFFPSPFEQAAIVTLDGVGEWTTASIAHGRGNRIESIEELRFPHSLGLLYSAFTHYTGFKVNSGEHKLMGLAPYGEPKYAQLILERLIDLKQDGSFRLDMEYFGYCNRDVMTSPAFERLFGGPPREPEAPITQRELDLAASIQKVTEQIVLRIATRAHALCGSENLCLAGGVALNCVANGELLRRGPFERLWIQPAAGDAGGALGAALFVWHQLAGNARTPQPKDAQRGSLLGPSFCEDEVRAALDAAGAVYTRYEQPEALFERIAALLATEHVVGHCAGRMEFGPRALGNRSILGDPRSPEMQAVMNLKIKFRESFRPFAPAVLRERASELFELRAGDESPYMLLVVPVRAEHRLPVDETALAGLAKQRPPRSTLPAITHVDYSARVQTVDAERHPRFHRLLQAFERRTGCPALINTSFNVRGEPLVCSPADAYRCFMATDMDALVIESFLLLRAEQPARNAPERGAYLAQFEPD